MKGLRVSIIGQDCAGPYSPTHQKTEATLRLQGCTVFDSSDDRPPLALIYGDPEKVEAGGLNTAGGYRTPAAKIVRVRAVPVDPDTGAPILGGMFSGQYITTSDSRFPCSAPIPCHTRFER